MGRVQDKIALVTGGARGLGEATSRTLGQEGATVILTDLLDDVGEALAQSIRDDGGKAEYLHQDVHGRGRVGTHRERHRRTARPTRHHREQCWHRS